MATTQQVRMDEALRQMTVDRQVPRDYLFIYRTSAGDVTGSSNLPPAQWGELMLEFADKMNVNSAG